MRLGLTGLTVSCAVACLALAGCGGGQLAGGGQPAPHPTGQLFGASTQQDWPANSSLAGVHACKLIPAATIAETLGQLEEPPAESADGLTCFYNTQISSAEGGPSLVRSKLIVPLPFVSSEMSSALVPGGSCGLFIVW